MLLIGVTTGFGAETAQPDAEAAARAWYDTIADASDQARLVGFGPVGAGLAPLERAYEQLSPSLKTQLSKEDFLLKYRGLAQLRLLQVHPVEGNPGAGKTELFVEEERTMVIEGTPVRAWFEGKIALASSGGTWQICDMKDVRPEDIIGPLRGQPPQDPEELARAALQCGTAAQPDCNVTKKVLPQNTSKTLAKVIVQTRQGPQAVLMAKMHNGEWLALETKQETATSKK